MTLLEIKSHFQMVKSASIYQLSYHFKSDPAHLKEMLKHWIRKGKIRVCTKTSRCGTQCQSCAEDATIIYEWVG
jgi:putative ferrous iron transport protein C